MPTGPRTAIDGEAAWKRATAERERHWGRGLGRFGSTPVTLAQDAKFSIAPDASVFCIGSCFARNVEEHLSYNGVTVLSRRIVSPAAEGPVRPAGLVNKFTTASMLNEIRWAASPPEDIAPLLIEASDETAADLQLVNVGLPLARARERRHYLMREYFPRVFTADLVVLTLGLDECWYDREAGVHLNIAPSYWTCRKYPGRFAVEVLGYQENLAALEDLRQAVQARNPAARFVVTVSPVPLGVSFTYRDPAISTMRAKSMLRTAAEAFAAAHDDVAYFPSYEMIALAPRATAYSPDCRHVSDITVAAVIAEFIRLYMGRESQWDGAFTELGYLAANPDVETLVREARYESGYDHWAREGRAAGRPIMPPGGPTRLMLKSGATAPA